MMLASDISFLVKICGITTEEDARFAVEEGANALGFNFYSQSKRYVTLQQTKEIVRAVRGEYLRVGVFVNPTERDLIEAIEAVPLDVVQVHGNRCPVISRTHRLWKSIAPGTDLPAMSSVEAYLLDTPTQEFGGSGVPFAWELAAAFPHRAIIAGGLDGSNVAEAIATTKPWGVDACSRLESEPGKKDPECVRSFIRAAFAQAEVLSASGANL